MTAYVILTRERTVNPAGLEVHRETGGLRGQGINQVPPSKPSVTSDVRRIRSHPLVPGSVPTYG
jgi:hypothetical protein